MTVASGEINFQSKHDLICHIAKMKAATSAHSMADVQCDTFFSVFSVFIISLRIQRFYKSKRKYILHTNKENNIRNIVVVLMFQQLLATGCMIQNLAERKFGSGHRPKTKKTLVEHEPRLAHGRVVNKDTDKFVNFVNLFETFCH